MILPRPRLALLGLWALVAGLAACHRGSRSPGVPRVVSIEVADRSPGRSLDQKALAARVARVLRASGLFEVPEPGPAASAAEGQSAWRCRLDVGGGVERAGREGMLHAIAQVDCEPTAGAGADSLSAQALGDQPLLAGADPRARLAELAGRLVEDTVGLLVRQQRLRTGSLADLLAALGDRDADVRRQAVRAAAYRRAREAVPRLIALLDDPQEDLRDMALGALSDIGDPQAVKALTSRVKFGDVDQLRRVIDPIAAMGGEEARAFLEFVASGHEDPEMRKLARSALERMDRRARAQAEARGGRSEARE